MAQLNESKVVLKISKLLKDGDPLVELLSPETLTNLEAVLEELINDPQTLIEINVSDDE
jgi:uncharacterized protein YbaP (TraB family)